MMYTDLFSFEGPAATDAKSALKATQGTNAGPQQDPAWWKVMFTGTVGAVIGNIAAKPQHNRK